MRLFVVLALATFAVCQASVLRSDEPKPHLELVKDAFWEYFVKATKSAHDSLQTFGESEFGQEVSTKIKDSVAVAHQYAAIAQDQVSTIGQEYYNKVSEQVERLQQNINEVRAQLEPYTEDMKANIQHQLGKLKQAVNSYRESLDTAGLEDSAWALIETTYQGVNALPFHLESKLGPSTKELKEKVQQRMTEFFDAVEPLVKSLRDEILDKVKAIDLAVYPYIEDLKNQMKAYVQDLES